MRNKPNVGEDVLKELYVNQGISMNEISAILGCSVGFVYNRIKTYGIQTRTFRTFNERARAKMSASMTGRKHSEETKRKLSIAHKGKNRGRRKFIRPSAYGGHRKKRGDGYISVYAPGHPNASRDGYVMEHILVVENHIGRYLKSDECVHHINHIRNDNRIENLRLMTFSEHMSMHMNERWAAKRKEKIS